MIAPMTIIICAIMVLVLINIALYRTNATMQVLVNVCGWFTVATLEAAILACFFSFYMIIFW